MPPRAMVSSNAPAATMYSFTFRRSSQTGIAHWTKARRWSSKSSRDRRDCRPRTWLWSRSPKQTFDERALFFIGRLAGLAGLRPALEFLHFRLHEVMIWFVS